jgi:hypothetical protein
VQKFASQENLSTPQIDAHHVKLQCVKANAEVRSQLSNPVNKKDRQALVNQANKIEKVPGRHNRGSSDPPSPQVLTKNTGRARTRLSTNTRCRQQRTRRGLQGFAKQCKICERPPRGPQKCQNVCSTRANVMAPESGRARWNGRECACNPRSLQSRQALDSLARGGPLTCAPHLLQGLEP